MTDEVQRIWISPPFGRWFERPWATSVLGSYTWERRPHRWFYALKTVRPIKGGWVNKVGLRNPGIHSIQRFDPDKIYSVVDLLGDWGEMLWYIPSDTKLELNLSCPNTHAYGISPARLGYAVSKFPWLCAKLPPDDKAHDMIHMCVEAGVKRIHLSNTIPVDRGGESGDRLFDINLPIVQWAHNQYPTLKITAGGGIYNADRLRSYWHAGATFFSLSTVFFKPWTVENIAHELDELMAAATWAQVDYGEKGGR